MGADLMTVVVIGAGITGLTTALTVLDERPGTRVAVLEAADHTGGKIATEPFAGFPVDCAADAFLARVPDAVTLCERLGLADQLVTPAERSAYLFSRGALRRFPTGLVLGVPTDLDALARSGVVSPEGMARAALDLTMGPDSEPVGPIDESVGALVRRRLGDEVYEVLVGPLLSGVNAGDADWLSVAAGAPQFTAALRDHGSLIAGARAQLVASAVPAGGPAAPVFYGLPGGMHRLIDALVDAIGDLGGEIHCGSRVTGISIEPGKGYRVEATTAAGTSVRTADAVVLATPLFATAPLIAPFTPDVAAAMTQVDYASPVMITLAVPKAVIDHPLDASGFLVASPEGLVLTACSWASSKWAHLDSADTAILRASAGRHHDLRADSMSDDALVRTVLRDLATTMGLEGPPTAVRVTRWPQALPQFRVGHLDRVQDWRAALTEAAPGLIVTGAGFEGLGLPACIRQGRVAAKTLIDQRV
jgi:protoporphyrinogen/coproporphyrinogen III oxidase